ncbi:MAG: hypothetical protein M1840_004820 [Geoglossum simile]|nr:MAG: hypothetical protein M1840_004820 [Geoglossum simile]
MDSNNSGDPVDSNLDYPSILNRIVHDSLEYFLGNYDGLPTQANMPNCFVIACGGEERQALSWMSQNKDAVGKGYLSTAHGAKGHHSRALYDDHLR